jgi:hypothetical protein
MMESETKKERLRAYIEAEGIDLLAQFGQEDLARIGEALGMTPNYVQICLSRFRKESGLPDMRFGSVVTDEELSEWVAAGKTKEEIAAALGVTPRFVGMRLSRLRSAEAP